MKLITCIECKEKAAPAEDDHRSQFCQPCADRIKAELLKPRAALATTPAGFYRNDARMP